MGLLKIAGLLACALALQVVIAAPAAAYEWPELLQEGDKNRAVKALQVRLAGWYPDRTQTVFEIDGAFSAQTRVALEAFQAHYGLAVDGIAGLATFQALNTLEDPDHTTIHFDFSEFWQNRNSKCSKKANTYAGTFEGGLVPKKEVKRNVRRMMWRLEALRAKLGDKPIAINSGFRSVPYNKCIRGASMSQHMYGTAADLRVVEVSNRKARNNGKGSQIHGIGCYSSLSHNHFDLRMQNESLEAGRFWWWPKVDEFKRHLASDGLPCWGEVKKGSVQAYGAATYESNDHHGWSEAELDDWKAAGEAPNLHGLD